MTPSSGTKPIEAHLDWVRKVWDDGTHNAVTDLARWHGLTYLAFRSAVRHGIYPPGEVVILRSSDLVDWEVCARITSGLDDRDPKLVPDGDRLWCFFGSTRYDADDDGTPSSDGRRWNESFATWTETGTAWEVPAPIAEPGYWLWGPARFPDGFFATAYGAPAGSPPEDLELSLWRSYDGLDWSKHATVLGDRKANEATLYRERDGRLCCLARGVSDESFLLSADAPFVDWTEDWRVPHWMHAPAVAECGGGRVVVGRDVGEDDAYVTRVWALEPEGPRFLLDLPSGGDTSYAGLIAETDGSLLVSYYSQHEFLERPGFVLGERPAAIYLARLTF